MSVLPNATKSRLRILLSTKVFRLALFFLLFGGGELVRAQQPLAAYATDASTVARGKALFQTNCSACHNFLQRGIGPELSTVTATVPADWIRKFIRNAPEVIKGGDARAYQLYEEYKQMMPPFTQLTDGDVQALLAFIHASRKAEAVVAVAGPAPLVDPIPARIGASGLRLVLEEVLTAPATAEKAPLARINKMAVLPGKTDRLFLEDLRGPLYELVDNKLQTVFDLRAERSGFIHVPGLATGFGSYAFHPDFYNNGLLYTTHTEKAGSARADFGFPDSIRVSLQWVLTEWTITDPAGRSFSGPGRELMRVNMVSPIHGMQEITFDPTQPRGSPDYGLLYIGIGDGGATEHGYPFICRDKSRVWSSVLRIDPRGNTAANGRYGIPSRNPYAADTDPATAGEVFCRGFRNPNRIYWAPDGKMLISDIGHANAEELNIGRAGADYGWPEREGLFRMNYRAKMDKVYPLPPDDPARGYTYPAALYDHDEGNAISAGFVYSGTELPLLQGKYVFGDIVNGRVFCVDNDRLQAGKQAAIEELQVVVNGRLTTFRELTRASKTDLRFGQGLQGDLYLYTKTDGKIYRVKDCQRE